MAQLVVRNLPEELKEKLRERAKSRGRSLEAEVRKILEEAARKPNVADDEGAPAGAETKGFGDLMHERFGKRGFTAKEARRLTRAIEELRDTGMMRVPDFEEC